MKFEGIIVKRYSGFYYILSDDKNIWECSLRGRFRLKKQTFFPGDNVVCTKIDEDNKKAVIEEVLPRFSELERPLIANVDQVVIVLALSNILTDLQLLDRIMIMAQYNKVKPIICFNKVDIIDYDTALSFEKVYKKTNFPVFLTSALKDWGIEDLKQIMKDKISVFAGPSGVGKSSLFNALEKGLSLETGEVSKKLNRGKHTTRHTELLPLSEGGLLADTPGFSKLDLPQELKKERLIDYYPDFWEHGKSCSFCTCLHRNELECGVRKAAESGILDEGRYNRYLHFLEEVITNERRY